MDGCLLDTDTVSLIYRDSLPEALRRRLLEISPELKWVSAVTIAEMLEGAFALIRREEAAATGTYGYHLLAALVRHFRNYQILEFDEESKAIFRMMPAAVKRLGRADCKIAANAIRHNLTVVTRNTRHFSQIAGVRIEDWTRAE